MFYHLGAFEESLNYALGAGDLFNVNDNSEYVETIIGNYLPSDKVYICRCLSCSSGYSLFIHFNITLPDLSLIEVLIII